MSGSEIYRLAENMERKCKKLVRDARSTLKLDQNAVTETMVAEGANNLALSEKHDSKTHSGGAGTNNSAQDDEDDDFGYDPERYVPFSEKADFADLIKRVTKEGLTQIVNYLLEK